MSLLSSLARSPEPKNDAADAVVREVGLGNFVADVIEASRERVVVIDFWTARSPQSKQFSPLLEKVVRAAKGAVRLAKIDVDKNPEIAQQLRVQSIPAVFAFFRGQPVDGFAGAMPEAQIKTWLDRLVKAVGGGAIPDGGVDEALKQAAAFLVEGDAASAQPIYTDILDMEPDNAAAYAGLLRCLIVLDDIEHAKEMLEKAPPAIARDKALDPVRTAIELAEQSGKSGSATELEARLAQNPADHQTRFDLAMAHYAKGQKEQAVDQLLEIVRRQRNWNEEAARKQLVKLFEAFGNADPLTVSGRKRLSSILFA